VRQDRPFHRPPDRRRCLLPQDMLQVQPLQGDPVGMHFPSLPELSFSCCILLQIMCCCDALFCRRIECYIHVSFLYISTFVHNVNFLKIFFVSILYMVCRCAATPPWMVSSIARLTLSSSSRSQGASQRILRQVMLNYSTGFGNVPY
jgi:hypothetical protein